MKYKIFEREFKNNILKFIEKEIVEFEHRNDFDKYFRKKYKGKKIYGNCPTHLIVSIKSPKKRKKQFFDQLFLRSEGLK